MATPRVYVLGAGDDLFLGNSEIDQRILAGRGADLILTGGGNKIVNTGMQFGPGERNAVYAESLAGFRNEITGELNPWIGGHILQKNGYWQGFKQYEVGPGDEGRMTIPANRGQLVDGEFMMHIGLTRGVWVLHGPGDPGGAYTKLKSVQHESQKIVVAADGVDDVVVTRADGIVTRDGDNFDFNVKVWRMYDDPDNDPGDPPENPGDAGQRLQVDYMYLQGPQQVHLEIEENTMAARFDAIEHHIADLARDGALIFNG